MIILVEASIAVQSTYLRTKNKNLGQLVFVQDMIPPINHVAHWRYICQLKQAQIEKYFIRGKTTIFNYDYRVEDQLMIRNKSAFKYKTPLKCPYENFQTWTNGNIAL